LTALVYLESQSQVSYNKALALSKTSDLDAAIFAARQSLEADKTNVRALVLLGKLYAQQNLRPEARAAWEQAMQLEPEQESAKAGLAILDQQERAEAEAKKATSIAARRRQWAGLAGVFAMGVLTFLLVQWIGQNILSSASPTATTVAQLVLTPTVPNIPTAEPTQTSAPTLIPSPTSPPPTQVPSPTRAPQPTASPTVSLPTVTPIASSDLKTLVEKSLKANSDLKDVAVEVKQEGAVVYLSGQVSSVAIRSQIEETALAVSGVKVVDSGKILVPSQEVQPTSVVITKVVLEPITLTAGQVLSASFTVRNNSNATLGMQEPNPGFMYEEGDTFASRGFPEIIGYFRVGVDFENRAGIDHPYRWGLGVPLAPGQTTKVTGQIRLKNPQSQKYWVGLVHERLVWLQDNVGTLVVTVK
jgi:hypothetical protein